MMYEAMHKWCWYSNIWL